MDGNARVVAGGLGDGERDGGTPPAFAAAVDARVAMGGLEIHVSGDAAAFDGCSWGHCCCFCCCCCCVAHLNEIAMGAPSSSRIFKASCNIARCSWLKGGSKLCGNETLQSCSKSVLISGCSKSNEAHVPLHK